MSGRPINIEGQRFSRLVALRLHHVTDKRGAYWTCRCDCGNETVASLRDLRDEGAKSCGCLWREAMRDVARDKSTTRLTWADVRDIQRAFRAQKMTRTELARQYGVSHQAITNALKAQIPGEAVQDITLNKAHTKLTWLDVRDIQRAFRAWWVPPGGLPVQMMTRAELARRYGVTGQTISNVLKARVPEHPESQGR